MSIIHQVLFGNVDVTTESIMAILRVKHGPNNGKVYELSDKNLVLGREPGDGIVVPDQGVSRKHAEVARIGEVYFIRDLDSRNGTFVNDKTIREEILRYGDRIRVGNSVLIFEDKHAYLRDSSRLIKDSGILGANPSSTIQFRLTDVMKGMVPPPPADAIDTPEKKDLNVLFTVAHIIDQEKNFSVLHSRIAETVGRSLEADHTYILLRSKQEAEEAEEADDFELLGRYDKNEPDETTAGVSRGIIKDCMTYSRAVLTADAAFDEQFKSMESVVANQLHSVMCVPITSLGECRGVVYSYSHRPDAFSPEDLELASVIGIQLGTAIGLLKVVENSDRFFRNSIQALVAASEMRNPETRGNCRRIAMYCLATGKELNLDTHELRNVWLVGMLYNIGLIPMTDSEQQQKLTLETKKNHYAKQLLTRVPELEELLPAIQSQNETYDGSGSPEAKKGDEIPLLGRILAAAIDLDRLLYGVASAGEEISTKQALLQIRDGAGKRYDPEVVKAMLIAYRKGGLFNEEETFFNIPF